MAFGSRHAAAMKAHYLLRTRLPFNILHEIQSIGHIPPGFSAAQVNCFM
jgi:hypothetical protein